MGELNLKECFSKVRQGDGEAFAAIYSDLKQPVYTIVCRIVQSGAMAEDVTQDVFVKLFVSPPDSSVRNLRAWVFRMAHNLAIDALRKEHCTNMDDVAAVAEDQLGKVTTRLDIEAAIGRLPRDEREVLSLHLNAELHFNQIATIVGLSLPATYRKYRKAIGTLRELLSGGGL